MDITSRDNRFIREYRHLIADGKYRRRTGCFALEGARLCSDAVLSCVTVETVLFTARAKQQYPTHTEMVRAAAPAYEISDALADFISDTTAPQGLFCICRMPAEAPSWDTLSTDRCYAALESVQDPGNLGTMIRTAEAFGLGGLLLSDGCCDPYNPKVLRSSMGGVFRLPLFDAGQLSHRLLTLSKAGFRTVACVVDAEASPIQTLTLGGGTIAVIGNEGNGLTPETVAACSHCATIPMAGRAESLNASMAAGIVFWEMMRKDR
ncbi:MAG: RNA methyltransferase [Clostridia bacterium]|nr:RNA methyltransferase [Clostridia bacterium]